MGRSCSGRISALGETLPDERLTRILTEASAAGELMAQANSFAKRFPGARYCPDRQWDLVLQLDESDQRAQNHDQLLERAAWFYEAVSFSAAMKSHTPGKGHAYLATYTDSGGARLTGDRQYVLHVPADPPAKLFWSVTVYDAATRPRDPWPGIELNNVPATHQSPGMPSTVLNGAARSRLCSVD